MRSEWTPDEYRNRPKDLDPLVGEHICALVANGDNLVNICKLDRDLPLPATFLRWVKEDETLRVCWRAALHTRADVQMEEILYIEAADPRVVRNEFEIRKFHVERMVPEKYGPRARITLDEGKDDDAGGGADYSVEFRRKIEAMAARQAAEQRQDS